MRAAAAVLVVFAVAALPIVIDHCTESCEMHRSAPVAAPTCHHAASSSAHIGAVPVPCGHDHQIVFATATASIAERNVASALSAVMPTAHQPIAPAANGDASHAGSPPPAVIGDRPTLHLRV
jgi:hypothetical protein